MTGQMILILVGVVGGVVLLGLAAQVVQGVGRAWRELAERYPAQGVGPEASRGEAQIVMGEEATDVLERRAGCLWILMPWTWFRGMRQVRYAADDEYLHLETEGGVLAPRSSMSIPWGEIEVEGTSSSHMGEYALLRIGGVVIGMPAAAIERELGIRSEMEARGDGDPTQTEDPGADEFRLTEDL